jgi:hypothetical protein
LFRGRCSPAVFPRSQWPSQLVSRAPCGGVHALGVDGLARLSLAVTGVGVQQRAWARRPIAGASVRDALVAVSGAHENRCEKSALPMQCMPASGSRHGASAALGAWRSRARARAAPDDPDRGATNSSPRAAIKGKPCECMGSQLETIREAINLGLDVTQSWLPIGSCP